MQSAILNGGLRLLAVGGTDALTVRGLARELGVVPSALYRYVTDRDDLLTMLIVHAYGDLADHVQAAHDAADPADLPGRWRALTLAIRQWAVGHPHEFALIYGTPVPGYHAPPDQTEGPSVRVLFLLARLGVDAERVGAVADHNTPFTERAQGATAGLLAYASQAGLALRPATALIGVAAWHMLMGALFTEVFGHFGPDTLDGEAYYDEVVLLGEELLFGRPRERRADEPTG